MSLRELSIPVEGGAVPIHVQGPEDASSVPGLVVIPSIFGPAPDLLRQMASLSDAALTVVADPFWRGGGGAVPYSDRETAFGRLQGFDVPACLQETRAVIAWTRERCNGKVAGLGICFGGPVVLTLAGEGALDGLAAWHGSRMEAFLDRASEVRGPIRFHYGSADTITPPEAIEAVRAALSHVEDARFVVHEGLEHGFSHEGESYDEAAARAGLEDTRELLSRL
ncbi:MAG: dienelactone hydrolase family protein [Myxococcota bacterium]|nr:dienelactone hydrolase family protein [Myxococcota bacterium]